MQEPTNPQEPTNLILGSESFARWLVSLVLALALVIEIALALALAIEIQSFYILIVS